MFESKINVEDSHPVDKKDQDYWKGLNYFINEEGELDRTPLTPPASWIKVMRVLTQKPRIVVNA